MELLTVLEHHIYSVKKGCNIELEGIIEANQKEKY